MKLGVEVFLENGYKSFTGKSIGLVTNMTGVNQKLIPTIELFVDHPGITLKALYGPEHGIRGDAKEGEEVQSSIDPYTNLPVYSLYGDYRKPTKEMLESVDVIVFDLQDIGSRYFTYIYTMAYVMEACGELGKQFVVLDRPNPISGERLEGNLVEEDVRSFVGLLPIPNRHGMTIGELAQLFKYKFGYDCDLTVVPMEGWNRAMYFDDTSLLWVAPSPNTTNIDMNILYPGTCLIEGTNLSEGRGTTRPFEWIGAPYIDGHRLAKNFNDRGKEGVIARPISFKPTYQKHKDITCGGIQLHIVDRYAFNSWETGLLLLETVAELYPNNFSFIENEHKKYFFDLLAGAKSVRERIWNGTTKEYIESSLALMEDFQKEKKIYDIYN